MVGRMAPTEEILEIPTISSQRKNRRDITSMPRRLVCFLPPLLSGAGTPFLQWDACTSR